MSKLSARRRTWLLTQEQEKELEEAKKKWANGATGKSPDLIIIDEFMDTEDKIWSTHEPKEPEENT